MSMGKKLMHWVDARFPATETYEYHMSKYYAPKNFNFWYFFGVLSMIVLVNQLVTARKAASLSVKSKTCTLNTTAMYW